METLTVRDLKRSIESGTFVLPTTFELAIKVIEAAANDAPLDEIVKRLKQSPTAAANVIAKANSSSYGGCGTIDSVSQAVTRIGLNMTVNIILSLTLVKIAEKSELGRKVSEEAIAFAECAKWLAAKVAFAHLKTEKEVLNKAELAYTLSLFCHLGIFAMLNLSRADGLRYVDILNQYYDHKQDLQGLEESEFGITHAKISYWILACRENFPQLIMKGVENHDLSSFKSSDKDEERLIHVVQLASKIAAFFSTEDPLLFESILRLGRKSYAFDDLQTRSLLVELQVEINETLADLGLSASRFKSPIEIYELAIGRLSQLLTLNTHLKERLYAVTDHLASGIYCVDSQYNISFVNNSEAGLYDQVPRRAIGKKCFDVFSNGKPCSNCPAEIVFRTGGKIQMQNPSACSRNFKKRQMIDLTATPIIADGSGDLPEVLIEIQDITPRLEQERRYLQSVFTGTFVHEMNNFLQVASGKLALIPDFTQGDEQQNKIGMAIKAAKYAVEKMYKLTHQFSVLSKPMDYSPQVIVLSNLVVRLKELLLNHFTKEVQFITDLDKDLWYIKADESLLTQVVINLVINARDAITNGNGRITIKTANTAIGAGQSGIPTGKYVLMTIADNGCGIEDKHLGRIFDPYFSTKGTKGNGLGLSLVKSIVTQHQGHIRVKSALGQGTTFAIFLPRLNQ